jgi:Skp family chaperone for outer membrane proteins
MKRVLLISIVTGSMIFSAPALAREIRIGVVNMQRAVSETKEGQKAEAKLKKVKLQKAMSVLKDSEKRKRLEEHQRQYQQLQQRYLEAERDLMSKKTKAMMKISKKLNKIITKIARREKYDYIFANAAVLWAPSHVDLTNEVIRQFNKR